MGMPNNPKRPFPGKQQSKRKKQKRQESSRPEGSHEEVLLADLQALLQEKASINVSNSEGDVSATGLPDPFSEVEVTIDRLSSTGDGLGHSKASSNTSHVYVVPFALPGDTVLAKVIRHDLSSPTTAHTQTDFLRVITPSPDRDDSLVNCKYFGTCSGCQFQMLPYTKQLAHKKTIVEKAYRNFSSLPANVVPPVGETIGSPLQYGYRTKLTPHFDGPQGGRRAARNGDRPQFKEVPPIGFMRKGTRWTVDIEECPIGTAALQMGLKRERKKVADQLETYKRGATILLRESTEKTTRTDPDEVQEVKQNDGGANVGINEEAQTVQERSLQDPQTIFTKTCISDNNATSTEYVGTFTFRNPANAFFQNNNSILPTFTSYIRDHILDPTLPPDAPKITNLIDAYCGSGLFTITLSSLFERSIGIDISTESIDYARTNAALNNLTLAPRPSSPRRSSSPQPTAASLNAASSTVDFTAGTASDIFASAASFNPRATALVIDPPRKGCDEGFLRQLLAFKPERVVYVSCNVHTQARDVGWILQGGAGGCEEGEGADSERVDVKGDYEIESLRGFDFFPQTSHVESVCVLRRKR